MGRGGDHDVRNGISLRTDLHKLLDRGYVTVDNELRFVVGRRLKADFDSGRSYYDLHGRPVTLPAEPIHRPSIETLAWHRENIFLG